LTAAFDCFRCGEFWSLGECWKQHCENNFYIAAQHARRFESAGVLPAVAKLFLPVVQVVFRFYTLYTFCTAK